MYEHYSLSDYPPLIASFRCPKCGQRKVMVSGDGTVRGACRHKAPRLRAAIRRAPESVELWGGQPGYAVAPKGAVALLRAGGYRNVAPFHPARQVHILGQVEDVAVALWLDEGEYVALTSPEHLPCDEDEVPRVTLQWLRERLLVGVRGDDPIDPRREGVTIFTPACEAGKEGEGE